MSELIDRQAAIDAIQKHRENVLGDYEYDEGVAFVYAAAHNHIIDVIKRLPSAQPTLCGYNIEHLILIADVLRKEGLPPEKVAEALTDIGRIVCIVRDEFEESLRKEVEQCKI